MICGGKQLTAPLPTEKIEITYYVTFEELFNVVHETYITSGRTPIIKKRNRKYKDVTVKSIVTYLRLYVNHFTKQNI